MKINLSVSKYNELKKYLEKTNKTLDEVLTTYYTGCIDYFKKMDQVKEEKIVKEIIERITQKNLNPIFTSIMFIHSNTNSSIIIS